MWGALSGHCRLPPLPAPTHELPSNSIAAPAQGIAANCVVRPQPQGSSSSEEEEEEQGQGESVDEDQPGTSAAAEHRAQQAQQAEQARKARKAKRERQQAAGCSQSGPLLPAAVLGDVLSDLPEVDNFCMMEVQRYRWGAAGAGLASRAMCSAAPGCLVATEQQPCSHARHCALQLCLLRISALHVCHVRHACHVRHV
jgi:hypothetical protein